MVSHNLHIQIYLAHLSFISTYHWNQRSLLYKVEIEYFLILFFLGLYTGINITHLVIVPNIISNHSKHVYDQTILNLNLFFLFFFEFILQRFLNSLIYFFVHLRYLLSQSVQTFLYPPFLSGKDHFSEFYCKVKSCFLL